MLQLAAGDYDINVETRLLAFVRVIGMDLTNSCRSCATNILCEILWLFLARKQDFSEYLISDFTGKVKQWTGLDSSHCN